jgi:hypothetical protein
MELVLLLHISQYDEKLERFRSSCFERSEDSGISVFVQECAEDTTGSVCAHARAFYGEVAGEPPTFWAFDEAILPEDYSLDEVPSVTGDDCHRNIEDVSNNRAKKFFKKQQAENPSFQICDGDESRPLTEEDIQIRLAKYKETLR